MLTRRLNLHSIAGALVLAASLFARPAVAQEGQVYTVSAYPVEATAGNAVAAKAKAMAEGREGAFRYLLKRIVDVGAYKRLPHVQPAEIEDMLDGLQVDKETNSRTEYIATLTYKFKADAIRDLLRNYKLPFFDRQADPISVITAFVAREGASKEGERAWTEAWASLDLVHSLTPVQLISAGPSATPEVFERLADGDPQAFGIVESEANAQRLVVALAELVDGGKKLRVKLVGADQSGRIDLASSYTLYYDDIGYTTEHAAIVALGVLEGRWKSVNVGFSTAGPDSGGVTPWSSDTGNPGADGPRLRVVAEFSGAGQWRDLRTRFLETPGVEDVEIASISAQNAEITFAYGNGIGELRNQLARAGIALGDAGGTLVMRIE
jgi:hypothetical protein